MSAQTPMSDVIEQECSEQTQRPHADVPTKTRLLWGLGGFADAMVSNGTASLINVIYVNAFGINAALVNLACSIPRFLDFISDPMIGHLSDNSRSRWGRRRPWMFCGLIISAIVGLLLWHPPLSKAQEAPAGFSPLILYSVQSPTFWYLAVTMSVLFAVGYASFSIPHAAMGYEMSTDYNERTHLFKWRFSAFALAGFLTPWFLPLAMWLEGPRAQVLKGSQGVDHGQHHCRRADPAIGVAIGVLLQGEGCRTQERGEGQLR